MASGGEVEGKLDYNVGSEDLDNLKCQPCEEDGELREAVGLCTDCQEYLCQRCFDGHRIPKVTRDHQLLDKQQMLQCQVLLTRKDRCTERCSQHDDKVVKYYCTIHCQLTCSVCLNLNHRACKGVLYIPDVAKDLASNEEFKKAESSSKLTSISARSAKLTENANQNIETFEKSFTGTLREIKEFEKELHDAVDKIVSEIVKQAVEMKSAEMKQLGDVDKKCKEVLAEIQATVARIETFRKSRQNCNLFTEMMKIESKLNTLDGQMTEVEREQSVTKGEINFTPNLEILETLKQTEAFGKLTVTDTKMKTEALKSGAMAATGAVVKAEHAQDINVKTNDDTNDCFITGSVFLPDNRLVITDRSNTNIKAVDVKQSRVITYLKLSSAPWDVAMINENQVAVTLPEAKKIVFVTVAANMIEGRSLPVGRKCWGVDYREGKLAVSFQFPHRVKVVDLQGTVLHTITTDKQLGQNLFRIPFYLTFGRDSTTLYVSNHGMQNVVCIKLDGTMIAPYTDSELQGPLAAMVDSRGKVYVCSRDSNTIHQLTPDCKKIRVLLTEADGLNQPYTVSYSEAENRLCVGMGDCNIKVYKAILGTD